MHSLTVFIDNIFHFPMPCLLRRQSVCSCPEGFKRAFVSLLLWKKIKINKLKSIFSHIMYAKSVHGNLFMCI